MPATRESDQATRAQLVDNYEMWLSEYSLLKVIILRIVRQRLGHGFALGDMALQEAYSALRKVADRFVDSGLHDEATEVDDGRERMEEETAMIVLRWLGSVSQIPSAFRILSDVERAAIKLTTLELVAYEYDALADMPVVPLFKAKTGSTRVVGSEEGDDTRDGDATPGEESSEQEEEAEEPTAGPAKKGSQRKRGAGDEAQKGPLAAKKVRRSSRVGPD